MPLTQPAPAGFLLWCHQQRPIHRLFRSEAWGRPACWASWWIGFWLLVACPAWGQVGTWPVQGLAVWVDVTGRESIEAVAHPDQADAFRPIPLGLSAGYTRRVYWLRFTVGARSGSPFWLEVQPTYLDDVRLYVPDGQGGFGLRQSGDRYPFSEREWPARGFVFRIDEPPLAGLPFYLRLETSSTSLLMLRAWAPADYHVSEHQVHALLGLYYGFLLTIIMVNIWLGLWREEATYRALIVYAVSILVFMLGYNGWVAQYLFPSRPDWANAWVSLSHVVMVAATAYFHRHALCVDRQSPILWVYLWGLKGAAGLTAVAYVMGYYTEAVQWLVWGALWLPVLGGYRLWSLWRNHRLGGPSVAVLYAAAFACYGLMALVLSGWWFIGFWHVYVFQIGTLLVLMAFSMGLYQRVAQIRQDRDRARAEAQQAQRQRDTIEQARDRQAALLSMLTHELKTPLAVIRLALGQLRGSDRVRSHAQAAISDIVRVVERCEQVDRVDHAPIVPDKARCDWGDLLRECIDQASQPDRVGLQYPPGLPALCTDRALLSVVCRNLIDNALVYGAAHACVNVALSMQANQSGVPCLVCDVANAVGPAGVPDAARVFQRFYRERTAMSTTGSGLGLYLAFQLTRRLGGQLVYRPPATDGLVHFVLSLPLDAP
jgi:two-component system, sensor histidine kinase LadS